MKNSETLKLFADPVFKYKFDDFEELNNELANYIYELQKDDEEGLKRSNKGGWHSKNFQLTDTNSIQYKFALKLQKYITDAFQKFGWKIENKNIRISEMWAIVNKENDFNVLHIHPNCYLSSAYYVKAKKNCGKFEIENPNLAKRHSFPEIAVINELNIEVASIDVSEGDLLLFPSYLPHKVGKNES